jgi:hypothetical protein
VAAIHERPAVLAVLSVGRLSGAWSSWSLPPRRPQNRIVVALRRPRPPSTDRAREESVHDDTATATLVVPGADVAALDPVARATP